MAFIIKLILLQTHIVRFFVKLKKKVLFFGRKDEIYMEFRGHLQQENPNLWIQELDLKKN